jgi:hypothetical protein
MIKCEATFMEDELVCNGFRIYQEDEYSWIVCLKNGNTKGFEVLEGAIRYCFMEPAND